MLNSPLPTHLQRRQILMAVATAGVGAWLAPAWAVDARRAPLALTPRQSEGPFYPVALPADSDADLLRNGQLNYRPNQVAWVEGVVLDRAGKPLKGGVFEIWQFDEVGRYDHPRDGAMMDPACQG
ncbi:MAG: intradiol ring-cleavage dioxygenase, partial [Burkholderiaceae bacterium]